MVARQAVFHSDACVAESGSFSPSAGKPRLVVAAWRAAGLPLHLHAVQPVSVEDLCAVHDSVYVRGVLEGRIDNGFGNRRADVAQSLPYTSGALLCAARHALTSGVACAPVSGFHHAHHAHAGGFCTFNGLVVTAARLLKDRAVRRVMILDLDMHFGDGTEDLLSRSGLAGQVENVTFGEWFTDPAEGEAYLARLEREVARFTAFDLILYQAGADVHVEDPLGGVLTTAQMRRRDRLVFQAAAGNGIPIAWNLAGGYQTPVEKVIALHTQTMRECLEAYRRPGPGDARGGTKS